MEALQFVFRDFWTWLGTIVLIGVACNGAAQIIRALWGK